MGINYISKTRERVNECISEIKGYFKIRGKMGKNITSENGSEWRSWENTFLIRKDGE